MSVTHNKQLQRTVARRVATARALHFIMRSRRAGRGGVRPLNCGVMRPNDLVVEPLVDVAQLVELELDARSDGRAMVSRLIQEWRDGRNRFTRAGERVYVARRGERTSGVCGLNIDPFAGSDTIGRVRRLYVAVQDRRNGVGSAVISHLIADARGAFEWIHLRTYDPAAASFYEAMGFDPVIGDEKCTHRRRVVA